MADNVTLSASVRTSLLSLKNTTSLIERTQNRLSTGLAVSGPIDDPVAYFQSKGLSDRASDFQEKKTNIDQGVSSLTTALDGINGVESLVRQLKGLALNAKSATSAQISGLVQQFNDLRTQIGYLTTDTQYQGLNLVNGTGSTLTVDFSNLTASQLNVDSVDVTTGRNGLNILRAVTSNGGFQVAFDSSSGGTVGGSDIISLTYSGTATSLTSGSYTFEYGTQTFSVTVGSAGSTSTSYTSTQTFAVGDAMTVQVFSAGTTALGLRTSVTAGSQNSNQFAVEYGGQTGAAVSGGGTLTISIDGTTGTGLASGDYTFSYGGLTVSFSVGSAGSTTTTFTSTTNFGWSGAELSLTVGSEGSNAITASNIVKMSAALSGSVNVTGQVYHSAAGVSVVGVQTSVTSTTLSEITGQYVLDSNLATQINSLLTGLDTALATLRTNSQTLGSNVALLQTRLDFTTSYVNTLTAGSGKLTLANLNEEGANLLALQTRQQLGIQSLSFAGQAEQSILSLFR